MFNIREVQEAALKDALSAIAGPESAQAVVYGPEPESDAAWVQNAMHRLETSFGRETVQQIRMRCQCGYAMEEKVDLVQRLFADTLSLEAFANSDEARSVGLFAEGGRLYLQFKSCPCPILATVEQLPSKTWCICTTGYSKVLFEQVFGCEVDIELLQAIKVGDERCLMRIEPKAPVWPE